jgi:hypothetical protein
MTTIAIPRKVKRDATFFVRIRPENKIWFHKYAHAQGYASASECFNELIEMLKRDSKKKTDVARTKKSA